MELPLGRGQRRLYYGAKGSIWSSNGREDNGDAFDINKVTGFSVGGRGLGRHATDQLLYDFGFAQFYRARGEQGRGDAPRHELTLGGAKGYSSRAIMMLRDDYIALYDDVAEQSEGQFVWVSGSQLPEFSQIKPGVEFERSEYQDPSRRQGDHEGRTFTVARARGRGDFFTLVSPAPLKSQAAPFGAIVEDSEFVLCCDKPLDYEDPRLRFRGTAGYARPGQLALFEGELLALDGFEVQREGGDFGISAAMDGERIIGHITGRQGGLVSIIPPAGFDISAAKASVAGSAVEVNIENGAIHFAVEIMQRDGTIAYEIMR
jgi:hypothetical protein